MKKLYINCQSGVSGDMMLGAMLNLGVPEEYLTENLSHLKRFDYCALQWKLQELWPDKEDNRGEQSKQQRKGIESQNFRYQGEGRSEGSPCIRR